MKVDFQKKTSMEENNNTKNRYSEDNLFYHKIFYLHLQLIFTQNNKTTGLN